MMMIKTSNCPNCQEMGQESLFSLLLRMPVVKTTTVPCLLTSYHGRSMESVHRKATGLGNARGKLLR